MINPQLEAEVKRRRTFAIISHPDAGKTTLTEKLLLYGGAIHLAGTVKARKAARHATSDWMEIEKQRGISVTSSVLQFDYAGCRINILDTPGHQDFSEDTYRTLLAADSAVMLIDAAKGVEEQTKKLFWVCRQRRIPVFTFVNKLDRHGRSPFELMDEIEKLLGIRSYPINWPVGMDGDYHGVYNRETEQVELFDTLGDHGQKKAGSRIFSLQEPALKAEIGDACYENLLHDIELLDLAGDEFNQQSIASGELTPMYFGSAMTNFGVRPFLESFLKLSPSPSYRLAGEELIDPLQDAFSAFVFKIQANMNPAHRDRIAFLRICSGVFEKGMSVVHRTSGKTIRLSQPQQFLAQDRVIIEEAYPGDIIGVFDPGVFGIGDTLSAPDYPVVFSDFPVFPPELFARVQPKDSMKRKQFVKGMEQLAQEGTVQIFSQPGTGMESYIAGAIGQLQFEVLEHRLRFEYNAEILMHSLPYSTIRWLIGDKEKLNALKNLENAVYVVDRYDRPVLLVSNEWALNWLVDRHPDVQFLAAPPNGAIVK